MLLGFFLCCVAKLLIRHEHGHAATLRNHMQLHMRILVVTLGVQSSYSARFAQHHHTAL